MLESRPPWPGIVVPRALWGAVPRSRADQVQVISSHHEKGVPLYMTDKAGPTGEIESSITGTVSHLPGRAGQYLLIGLAAALVLASLWLPPVSLGDRLFHWNVPLITAAEGGSVAHLGGARLDVAPAVLQDNTRVLIEAFDAAGTAGVATSESVMEQAQSSIIAMPDDESVSAALVSLPTGTTLYSPFYRVATYGEAPARATFSVPLPYEIDSLAMVDLYAWDGQTWRWVPSHATSDTLFAQTEVTSLPAVFAVGTPNAVDPQVSISLTGDDLVRMPEMGLGTAVTVNGWTLDASASVIGKAPSREMLIGSPPQVLVCISNTLDGVLRSDLVDNLLIDPAAVRAHAQAIAARATSEGYDGIELAYLGVNPDLRAEFTSLVTALDAALAADDLTLAVRVSTPVENGSSWDTGAFDWKSIGQAADMVRLELPADPAAYASGGTVGRLLTWAVGEVQRTRLEVVASAYTHDVAGEAIETISYQAGLNRLTDNIKVENPAELLMPGETLRFGSDPDNQRTLELDPASQVNWFSYESPDGQVHTVWLENARSLVRKLQVAGNYGLKGAVLEAPLAEGNDQSVLPLVAMWQDDLIATDPEFAMTWQVQDTEGNVIRQVVTSVDDPHFAWVAPQRPGNYEVRAAISDDGGATERGVVTQLGVQIPTPTFTPTPRPTNTPQATATPEPTNTPSATRTPAPTPEGGPTPKPTTAPVTGVPAAGRVGGYFGYGIQAHIYGGDAQIYGLTQGMGFNWIKQQVEWSRTEPDFKGNYQWGDLDRIVGGANAAGLNVLLSVVKAPAWARPGGNLSVEGPPNNPQDFADFLSALATRYKGRVRAYEVWNEQNLHYEWGNEPISASRYVELLRYAFIALKNADPGAVVISGAPTPTGANDGVIAIDDLAYLRQMYQAGLARYCDAVGVHPSGFNNPPDARFGSWSDPSAPDYKAHRSFYFRSTMEEYRGVMVANGDGGKRLWPTEFGWSTFENLGASAPEGYMYANNNSEAEQAQWLVQAFQMARNWGWVGPMFVWNLNFAPVSGPANEKAGFGILRADWSPRPSYSALQGMAK
jgi:hypothetical protein